MKDKAVQQTDKNDAPQRSLLPTTRTRLNIAESYAARNRVTLFRGDCRALLRTIPPDTADLIVTSPPYNLGKPYERRLDLQAYLQEQTDVIKECVRVLSVDGSICWQVGNYVQRGAITPLDVILYPIFAAAGLVMRNRIVWHFQHGLHCARRFSGRYEVIMWFTKSDKYIFNLDPVRVPQKYPGKKHFKGPNSGKFSCNPKGKNPGDVWEIPNVKHNHVEKTTHPCQFPVQLVENLVLSLSRADGLVIDPFMGVGSTAVAAFRHKRRVAGAEMVPEYCDVAQERLLLESRGELRTRPRWQPVYRPTGNERITRSPFAADPQLSALEAGQ